MASEPTSTARTAPGPVTLDGATLTPKGVALIAREGAQARLSPEAQARNDRARDAIDALLARGEHLYGVTTGVGALRAYPIPENLREEYSLSLLRSHACGAGPPLPAQLEPLARRAVASCPTLALALANATGQQPPSGARAGAGSKRR